MKIHHLMIPLLFIGCSSIKESGIDPSRTVLTEDTSPKIIFLNFKVIRNSDKIISANLINKIIAEGSLKTKSPKASVKKKGDFECNLLDEKLMLIDSYYLPNPLMKNVEFVDPSGALGRKLIELDSTEVSIRMQLPIETHQVRLEIIGSPNRNLLEIEL